MPRKTDEQERRDEVNGANQEAREAQARVSRVEANAPDQPQEPEPGRPQPSASGAPQGVTEADVAWWNNSQNRNYMAGDGPQAGITEVDGEVQGVSSVDPEIRATTMEESRAEEAARLAENDDGNPNE